MTLAIENVRIRKDTILVYDMEFGGRKTASGIILRDDDMKVEGARPRWSQVLAVGPDVTDVKVGQYILMPHGEWTRGFDMLKNDKKILARMIRNTEILLVADEPTIEFQQAERR
jgi:hypothetical protein